MTHPPRASRLLAVPLYLAAHAAMGAAIGGLLATVILGTEVLGLAPLVERDAVALVLVPSLMGLFAVATAATAMALLGDAGGEGSRRFAQRAYARRLVAIRADTRR